MWRSWSLMRVWVLAVRAAVAGEQFLVGFVIGTFGIGGVALDFGQRVAGAFEEDLGEGSFGSIGLDAEHGVEDGGFDAADASETPARLGHLAEQEQLVLGLRIELQAKFYEQLGEGFAVFAGQDDLVGGESMRNRIAADGGLPGFATRAGTVGGILLISLDLGCGAHRFLFDSTVTPGKWEWPAGGL